MLKLLKKSELSNSSHASITKENSKIPKQQTTSPAQQSPKNSTLLNSLLKPSKKRKSEVLEKVSKNSQSSENEPKIQVPKGLEIQKVPEKACESKISKVLETNTCESQNLTGLQPTVEIPKEKHDSVVDGATILTTSPHLSIEASTDKNMAPKKIGIIEIQPQKETKSPPAVAPISNLKPIENIQLLPSFGILSDPKKKECVYRAVQKAFGIGLWDNNMYYPGPNPVSLRRDNIPIILQNEYMVTPKSDGVRYMLVLTRDTKGEPLAVMMNRGTQCYEIKIHAKDHYFDGTVADGELVWENSTNGFYGKRMVYMVFDLVSISGKNQIKIQNLKKRLEKIQHLFYDENSNVFLHPSEEEKRIQNLAEKDKILSHGNHHSMYFKPKSFYSMDQFDLLEDLMEKQSSHKNDGIIIMPVKKEISTGTAKDIFKFKTHHTIDLVLSINQNTNPAIPSKWVFGLYFSDDRNHAGKSISQVKLSDACDGFEYDEFSRYLFTLCPNFILVRLIELMEQKGAKLFEGVGEFEIAVDRTHVHCSLVKLRVDKKTPNNWYVCQQTILNKRENITYDELKESLAPIRLQSMLQSKKIK